MGMLRKTALAVLAAVALGVAPAAAADEQFTFYGLQFGMPRTAVAQRYQLQNGVVKNPGHGMTDMELIFDREDQLLEIRASWPRPEDALQLQGLQRALREQFVSPVTAKFPSVSATVDEYGNRAAVRLLLVSTGLRERNIEFHKNGYLRVLQGEKQP